MSTIGVKTAIAIEAFQLESRQAQPDEPCGRGVATRWPAFGSLR
jgi:hypothetical protein